MTLHTWQGGLLLAVMGVFGLVLAARHTTLVNERQGTVGFAVSAGVVVFGLLWALVWFLVAPEAIS